MKLEMKKRWIWVIISVAAITLIIVRIRQDQTARTLVSEVQEEPVTRQVQEDSLPQVDEESVTHIGVHITGAVSRPDQVIFVPEGSRILDVIELAGGPTNEADLSRINLAAYVTDGQKIRVPFEGEEEAPEEAEEVEATKHLTNINSATKIELMELPGIGEKMAERIIEYRNEHGGFHAIEELMNVSGIGETKFNGLKDLVTCE